MAIADLLEKLRDPQTPISPADYVTALESIPRDCQSIVNTVDNDMQTLDQAIPSRRTFLQQLSTREELTNGDVDPSAILYANGLKSAGDIQSGMTLNIP